MTRDDDAVRHFPERSTDGFAIVGPAKTRSELGAETRVVFDEPAKFGLYAVRLGRIYR
jgi:hypothetical protein